MPETTPLVRLRYPLHAVLLVALAWAFYALVLLSLALFMLPIIPLAPLFVVIMISLGGLLASVHEYARSVATPVRATRLASSLDGKVCHASPITAQES